MTERAIEDMRQRVSWKNLTKRNKDGSIYRGLEKFEPEMEQIYHRTWKKIDEIQKEEKKAKENTKEEQKKLKILSEKNKDLERINNKLEQRNSKLEESHKQKTESLKKIDSELNQRKANLNILNERGLTDEVIVALLDTDIDNPAEAFKRVKTIESHSKYEREIDAMEYKIQSKKKEIKKLSEDVQKNNNQKQNETEELKSLKNQVAKLRQDHHLIIDAVDITKDGLGRYSKQTYLGLFREIHRIEIRGKPKATLEYLLERLNKAKQELELFSNVEELKAERNALLLEIDAATGTLRALQDGIMKPIKETEKTITQSMHDVANAGITEMKIVQKEGVNSINHVTHVATGNIIKTQKEGEASINSIVNSLWNSARTILNHLEIKLNGFIVEVRNWGKIREEAVNYRELINLAILFLGFELNEQAILNVGPALISRLTQRIDFYVSRKWSEIKTKAPQEISSNEFGINSLWEVNLTSVSGWLLAAVEEQARRQTR